MPAVGDSIDSVDLNALISSLKIDHTPPPPVAKAPKDHVLDISTDSPSPFGSDADDEAEDAAGGSESITNHSFSGSLESEIITIIDDGASDDDITTTPLPRRPATERIDLAASSSDEDDACIWAAPRSMIKKRSAFVIDSASESSDDDDRSGNEQYCGYDDEESDDSFIVPDDETEEEEYQGDEEGEEEEASGSDDDEENARPSGSGVTDSIVSSLQTVLAGAGAPVPYAQLPPKPPRATSSVSLVSFPAAIDRPQKPDRRSHAIFVRERDTLARDMYKKYNALVFQGRLPSALDISWNNRLKTTAGMTHYRRVTGSDGVAIYTARIELSSKVLDNAKKLERTLVHEMCHVAAWLIDHVAKPPHGPAFRSHAAAAMAVAPHIDVSTCHNYEIFFSHRWECVECQMTYGRHSKSIDETKKVCGACRGKLHFLGRFDRTGTPAKTRAPSEYNLFVKKNYAAAMAATPGAKPGSVLKELNARWRALKNQSSSLAGGGGSGVNILS